MTEGVWGKEIIRPFHFWARLRISSKRMGPFRKDDEGGGPERGNLGGRIDYSHRMCSITFVGESPRGEKNARHREGRELKN